MKQLLKYIFLFTIGGLVYILIEIAFRGYSHWSMFITGGICFILLGLINEVIPWEMPLTLQMLIGCGVITLLEFITGCIVNLWLGWNIWDYTELPLNFLGQICVWFSIVWYFVSAIGITLDDWLRYWWFGEEKPRYRLW